MTEKFREGEPKEEGALEKTKIFKLVCSWCGKDMGTKEGPDDVSGLDISHSICEECKKRIDKELDNA